MIDSGIVEVCELFFWRLTEKPGFHCWVRSGGFFPLFPTHFSALWGSVDVPVLEFTRCPVHLVEECSLFGSGILEHLQQFDLRRVWFALVSGRSSAGKIRSTVAEHFGTINAANLKRAHTLLETGKARGKIVLEGF